jgi:hypothetical protein
LDRRRRDRLPAYRAGPIEPRLCQSGRFSLEPKFVIYELDVVTSFRFQNNLPDVVNCDRAHALAPQLFDVLLDEIARYPLNIIRITVLRAGGYQRKAEEFVGITRKWLSVFVLHGPK